jgi:prepilin-type N-terminal cleavage/methylation domain-containing protein
MHTRAGFTLLEIIIAIALSSLLATMILAAVWQFSRTTRGIDERIDVYSRAMLVMHQLKKDISGACIPLEVLHAQEKKKQEGSRKIDAQTKSGSDAQGPAQEKKEEKKPLDTIFYGIQKDKNLTLLTFITNNPRTLFWNEQVGKAVPKITRVVYRLEPTDTDNSWALYRQESEQLAFSAFKPGQEKSVRKYKLIDGIKSLRATFIEIRQGQGNAPDIQVYPEWNRERKETASSKEQQSLVPQAVELELVLWYGDTQREQAYTVFIPIVPDFQFHWLSQKQPTQKAPVKPSEKPKKVDAKSSVEQMIKAQQRPSSFTEKLPLVPPAPFAPKGKL